jgi:hypothetical protein
LSTLRRHFTAHGDRFCRSRSQVGCGLVAERRRHDVLREQLDGSTGSAADYPNQRHDAAFWAARRATIEQAANAVAAGRDHDLRPWQG